MWRLPFSLWAIPDWNRGRRTQVGDILPLGEDEDMAFLRHGIVGLMGVGGVPQPYLGGAGHPTGVVYTYDTNFRHGIFGMSGVGGVVQANVPEVSQAGTAQFNSTDKFRHHMFGGFTVGGAIQVPADDMTDVGSYVRTGPTKGLGYIRGGYLIAFLSTTEFELHEVADVLSRGVITKRTFTGRAGSVVYPGVLGRLRKQQSLTRYTPNFTYGVFSFDMLQVDSPYNYADSVWPTHNSFPVLEKTFNWDGGVNTQFEFKGELIDTLLNNVTPYVQSDTPQIVQQAKWFLNGENQLYEFLAFIHNVAGRLVPFWIPSYACDLVPVLVNGHLLDVKECGYTSFAADKTSRTHIRIQTKRGEVLYRKILFSIPDIASTKETLTLNFPLDISAGDIKMVSFMNLARFDQDRFELAYKGPGFAQADTSIRTLRHDI